MRLRHLWLGARRCSRCRWQALACGCSVPPTPVALADPPSLTQAETGVLLAAHTPPKRARPLLAVVGINDATETTDYLVPTGILRPADVADVLMLATAPRRCGCSLR